MFLLNARETGHGLKSLCRQRALLPQHPSVVEKRLYCPYYPSDALLTSLVSKVPTSLYQRDLDMCPLLPNMEASIISPDDTHQQSPAPLVAAFRRI